VTSSSYYISNFDGTRVKFDLSFNILWANTYGMSGMAMALSPSGNYLLCGAVISGTTILGKMNSSTGVII